MESIDRVRANTSDAINRRIERAIESRGHDYSIRGGAAIARRIEEFDREWDIERVLETNASVIAFTGLMLSLMRRRAWLVLPGVVLPFLFQHAIRGWCPPIPILRGLGVRTRNEIDREKYALKVLHVALQAVNA
jgi:hypothetical protein